MKYSFVIPVYNRPDEVQELLQSLTTQTIKDFEVIIVEDGSQTPCEEVCKSFQTTFPLHYFYKENSGPGQSRNYGVERAQGEYVLILDSDVVVPEGYLQAVEDELNRQPCDAFGGPDRSHDTFTPIQKAISYSMTSFFTTGGIRGGKKKLDKFYPRSFNMGIRREVYQTLGGFSKMRFGEDIDFSIRIFQGGYSCRLFPEAWVYHKRRTNFRQFWKQVFNSGIARINLYKKYPESLKTVHLLPALFTVGFFFCLILILLGLISFLIMPCSCEQGASMSGCSLANAHSFGLTATIVGLAPLLLYSLLIFLDASFQYRSPLIGLLSIRAAFTQLTGYGCGFIQAWWKRCVLGKKEFAAYNKNFYK